MEEGQSFDEMAVAGENARRLKEKEKETFHNNQPEGGGSLEDLEKGRPDGG